MPGYKIHQLAGVGFVGLFFAAGHYLSFLQITFGLLEFLAVAAVTLFYSILPDIDVRSSKAYKTVLSGGLLVVLYSFLTDAKVLGIATTALLILISFFLRHRGFAHSFAGVLLFSLPLLVFHWLFFAIGLIAYTSHLVIEGQFKWR